MTRCGCGPFFTVSCCVVFVRVIGKKIPVFIEMLIDQPSAVGEGRVPGLFKVIEKRAIDRQRQASGGSTVRGGNATTAGPWRRDSGVFHDVRTDDEVAMGAL